MGAILCLCCQEAFALGQEAGSLLVFPYYDSHPTALTIVTVTNTNGSTQLDPNTGFQTGTVDVRFVYVDGQSCSPESRVERLTPNDTFTFIPADHNPEAGEEGFLYAYAVDPLSGFPISFDYLIGRETVIDAEGAVSFDLHPLSFGAGTQGPDDHFLALDGLEYEKMPGEVLIPRFLGQGDGLSGPSPWISMILFFNLTGGSQYTAVADVLIYNDNEQPFSSTVEFDCWEIMDLLEVSQATRLSFLQGTDHDPDEVTIGVVQMETGWIRIDGDIAHNYTLVFEDPAIYAVQIEKQVLGSYAAAALPFEAGEQDNGLLWATDTSGFGSY